VALIDSSAWIEYLRGTASAVHRRLVELITVGAPIAFTQPVVMELLIRARGVAEEIRLRRLVGAYDLIAFDADVDFEKAASISRRCRARGITVPALDCMIASVALRHDAVVLASDLDFARIASVFPLRLDPATPRS